MTALTSEPQLRILPTRQALMNAAAEHFVGAVEHAVAARGRFTWALAGGSTPRELYALLASEPFVSRVDWSKVNFFWGDERAVPPEHAQSNYRMVRETLLDTLKPETQRVHRMLGEVDPEQAVRLYTEDLARAFPVGPQRAAGSPPRFDLVLLGMGDDGHTASLFPGTPALAESSAWVAAAQLAPDAPRRLTLTFPVLNAARQVNFLVTGAAKQARIAEVLKTAPRSSLPAAQVQPTDGDLLWFIDQDAAKLLART